MTFGPVRAAAPETDSREAAERKTTAGKIVRSFIFDQRERRVSADEEEEKTRGRNHSESLLRG